jgi:DNA invertase Pin-like site-specific DNA recombinase
VSTAGQLLDRQIHALREAGCSRIFVDKLTGRRAQQPQLTACLDYLRADDVLVVPSLDRLSRSLQGSDCVGGRAASAQGGVHLASQGTGHHDPGGRLVFHVFAALAEFIRELIVRGTKGAWRWPGLADSVSGGRQLFGELLGELVGHPVFPCSS